ncbi:MAG TPA: hypothetical protein VIY48_10920, partial [Candidatus Paceibacterota bacterium]
NAHQPTVAGDVTREDRCKLALNVILDHAGFPSRAKPYFPNERIRVLLKSNNRQFWTRVIDLDQSGSGGHATISRNVRFGSLADICGATSDVRFTPDSDRNSRHPQKVMSALHPKADVCGARADVC